jgi:SAM-dependent methyltransferase
MDYYSSIKLSEADVQNQEYKKHLGGGAQHWERRGAFQLYLLKKMGLQKHDRLLDAGCGPIRSGVHFINFLDRGNYCGIDSNADFIRVAAETVAQNPPLRDKSPHLECVENFDFAKLRGAFGYALAFSVLNHCAEPLRQIFFESVSRVTNAESKIYVTHAHWFQAGQLNQTRLQLKRTFSSAREIADDLDMQAWGWPPSESIFPILELSPRK